MRIGVDAMGGDYAPTEVVRGAIAARDILQADDQIILAGQEQSLLPLLGECPDWQSFIRVADAPQTVAMDEPPVEAVRAKPNSSISLLAKMHKQNEVDAIVSAGNTGACVAAWQMNLRRLPGVHRPGIAVLMPTFHDPVVLCDVGANVDCRPQHLFQYAVMASIYLEHVGGVKSPRVGLLSIGSEAAKGNALVKKTRDLLKGAPNLRFVGNVEGRDLLRNVCDVIVCEGFVGNVCLKLMEGLADGLFKGLTDLLGKADSAVASQSKQLFRSILGRYDYSEHGGAPLLGVNGICIISHGSSNARAIRSAILKARQFATQGVNELITSQLGRYSGNGE
jgi:phosphate acyltransferase